MAIGGRATSRRSRDGLGRQQRVHHRAGDDLGRRGVQREELLRDRRRPGAGGRARRSCRRPSRCATGLIARARPSWPIVGEPGGARLVQREVRGDDGERRGRARRRRAGWHGRRRGATGPNSPSTSAAQPVRQAGRRVDRRADGVEHHQRGDGRAAVEHRAGRPDPALPPADDGARSRADDALRDRPVGRGVVGGGTRRRGRANAERPAATRSNTTAAGTIGTTPPGTGNPTPAASSRAITPSAAASPYADPPDSTMAWTRWTVASGRSRSVSRVPGAAPRTSAPATAPPAGVSTTVVPESPPSTCAWPTRRPTTSVRALCGPCGMRPSWARGTPSADVRTRRRGM